MAVVLVVVLLVAKVVLVVVVPLVVLAVLAVLAVAVLAVRLNTCLDKIKLFILDDVIKEAGDGEGADAAGGRGKGGEIGSLPNLFCKIAF